MNIKPIFDIFSKKEKKVELKIPSKIIIDFREKNSLVASELIHLGIRIEFKDLKVADYIVKDVAIERKTVSDFKTSMINKRIFKQLEELKQYKKNLLIIEGLEEEVLYDDKFENGHGIHANAIRGFLLSILLNYQIPVIFTNNYEDTAKFLYILSKKQTKEISLNAKKKSLNYKERLQYILEGFPGIGPKSAKKLLKKFKTLKNIINARLEDLTEVIGKKAEKFKELLEKKY